MEADEDTDYFGMSAASAFLQNTSMDTLESTDTHSRPALPANPAPNSIVGAYFSSNDSISTLGNTVVIPMATSTNTVSIGHENNNNDTASTTSGVTSVMAKDLLEANGGNIRGILDHILARLPSHHPSQVAGTSLTSGHEHGYQGL